MLTTTHPLPRSELEKLAPISELSPAALDVAETPGDPTSYTLSWFVDDAEKENLIALLHTCLPEAPPLVWQTVRDDIDYVAETRKNFPPLEVGPFFIARNGEPTPAGKIGITIPPNMAFGSGEHATTSGCLQALLSFTQASDKTSTGGGAFPGAGRGLVTHGLDVGSGSAILAIAAIKYLQCKMICTDCDAPSVTIGLENARANGVADTLIYVEDSTLTHAEVTKHQPYPLIFANILLEPLLALAPQLTALLAPGGHLILSGFTTTQAAQIESRYRSLGVALAAQSEQKNWVTHTWQK